MGYNQWKHLNRILVQKLDPIPDLFRLCCLLSIYPFAVIRAASHFPYPYNLIISLCTVFPISLCLTEVKYALFLLTEIPTGIEKPSVFNERLLRFLRKYCCRMRSGRGKWLFIHIAYHVSINAISNGFSAYLFFHRSLSRAALCRVDAGDDDDHSEAVDKFGDNFDDFAFKISCAEYLSNRTLNGFWDYKRLYDGCYISTAGSCGDRHTLYFVCATAVNVFFGIYW